MARRIEMSPATRKGIALAIGALCVCVVGAVLVVGRDGGSSELQAIQNTASGLAGGSNRGRLGQEHGDSRGPALADDGDFGQFRTCLEEHGVTLPERGQQRRAQPDGDLRSAFEACRRYLPGRPFGPGGDDVGPPPGSGAPWHGREDGPTYRGTV